MAPHASSRRGLPWIVATALFMEQLDATILNTAVPSIAAGLGVAPLALRPAVAGYLVALAIGLPASGWIADRFGARRVFMAAMSLFVLASAVCGLATEVPVLTAARLAQGAGAALMMPVGRLMIVRSHAKSELLAAMNFVIVPALVGALLGPTLGGLIVHWLSWRAIFFVNVPVGLAALWWMRRHLPDFRAEGRRPFDALGLALFGSAALLLSWLLGVFDEAHLGWATAPLWPLALALLVGYGWHARRTPHPLMNTALLGVRTFRVAVVGGFGARMGMGALPFLLPLLYQLGLGLPAWQAGLLMMPLAAGAMLMKPLAPRLLARHGYRAVLTLNTAAIGVTIALFGSVHAGTPLALLAGLGFAQGLFNSLQFSSVNSMAYADVDPADASSASTIASTLQQLSMSFGLALGALLTGCYLGPAGEGADGPAWLAALHGALVTLGVLTAGCAWLFRALRPSDGASVSGQRHAARSA